jgi:hypothetical protein
MFHGPSPTRIVAVTVQVFVSTTDTSFERLSATPPDRQRPTDRKDGAAEREQQRRVEPRRKQERDDARLEAPRAHEVAHVVRVARVRSREKGRAVAAPQRERARGPSRYTGC